MSYNKKDKEYGSVQSNNHLFSSESNDSKVDGVHLGSRGNDFKMFITGLLRKGNLKRKYVEMLTDEESMKVYSDVFTSELVDEEHNYQVYEQLGDLTGNKFIVSYMYRRFPQLNCVEGVKVVARLRINYGAKQSFSEIARKLGFWNFISAPNEVRQRKMKPLLEDVFEAFLGATESILDNRILIGVGYAIVYYILSNIFDEINISLKYEDLYDAKTRLKELFDTHEDKLGSLVYRDKKVEQITHVTIFRKIKETYIEIGNGSASLKSDAQQKAATSALQLLASQGWSKPTPLVYQKFSRNYVEEEQELNAGNMKKLWTDGINEMYTTREKTKYQSKYQSTPLSLYCRRRNISGVRACLELGADTQILDSDGLTCWDLLVMGEKDVDKVESIMRLLDNYMLKDDPKTKKMNRDVYKKIYKKMYKKENDYFKNQKFVRIKSNKVDDD